MFLIIFFIAGFLTILISVILWTSVRLTTMLENPPRVRIWSTLLLIVVPPFQGVLLGFIPIFVAQMSMSLLIKPIMAEDALFAFIPGYPVRYVFLCRIRVCLRTATPPPRRRRAAGMW